MSDPERLADEQRGALGQLLLSAAQDEEPPASLLERTLGSAGVSSTAATVSGSAAPSAAAGVSTLMATAKYAGLAAVGVLATGLALDAADTLMRPPSPVESAAARGNAALVGSVEAPARAVPTEPERARTSPALPLSDRAETSVPVSARDAAQQPGAPISLLSEQAAVIDQGREADGPQQPGSPSSLLREEAAVIDEAREAVATGNTVQALRALEAHRRRFARPLFQPEALYLKMQALRLQGDEPAARLAAQQLLAAYPNGTQASAARTFLKDATAGGASRAADRK